MHEDLTDAQKVAVDMLREDGSDVRVAWAIVYAASGRYLTRSWGHTPNAMNAWLFDSKNKPRVFAVTTSTSCACLWQVWARRPTTNRDTRSVAPTQRAPYTLDTYRRHRDQARRHPAQDRPARPGD